MDLQHARGTPLLNTKVLQTDHGDIQVYLLCLRLSALNALSLSRPPSLDTSTNLYMNVRD